MNAAIMIEANSLLLLASLGSIAFIGVYVILLGSLLCLPRSFIGQETGRPVWWKNLRFWASLICVIQILVYWTFG